MFHGICADILDAKWLALSELDFPIKAKDIAATDSLNATLRQFFFAEINHYSRKVLHSLAINTNISSELLANSDGEAIANILYDWIEFSNEETYNLLKSAIDTEIFFLISPVRCLANFLFSSNNENEAEGRAISEIIKELEFISDKQEIINTLKNELEELSNIQKEIARDKFADVANDIVFNIYQKQSIEDFLLPCKCYLEFSAHEDIPVDFVELFLLERDLTGVLTEIRDFAVANEKQVLSYDELYNEIGRLTGKLSETSEENVSEVEESLPETEEDNDVVAIEEIAEPDVIEEEIIELPDEEVEESGAETIEEIEDIQIEEAIELPEEEIIEETVNLEVEEFETTEEPADCLSTVDFTEEISEGEILEPAEDDVIEGDTSLEDNIEEVEDIDIDEELLEETPNDFTEEISEEEVSEIAIEGESELIAGEETPDESGYIITEANENITVPTDFEELVDAVEQEVDNTIADMDKEDIMAEETVEESPKITPVAVTVSSAIQEVMADSSNINSKMVEMRSHYINSKIAEMHTLGKTLFEIEHNYLEMETEHVAKILQLLKE